MGPQSQCAVVSTYSEIRGWYRWQGGQLYELVLCQPAVGPLGHKVLTEECQCMPKSTATVQRNIQSHRYSILNTIGLFRPTVLRH